MAQLAVNEPFAGHVVEGVLGRGGMGTVYLARHPRLPRRVALKVLDREFSADQELRRRFDQEANVVARLDHPGIVGIHDRGDHDGHLWISMQYIRGTDAAQAHRIPPERAVRIVTETAAALDYAHSQGVLHRDIKPANILLAAAEVGREARAVLTDFGIARLIDSNTQLTATGKLTATLAFASPEHLSGLPLDHRTDQYSLACTLFALLAGRTPYLASNPGQVIVGHLSEPVPRLSASRPELPRRLDEVIARGMAKQREERFASCTEFATAAAAAFAAPSPPVRNMPGLSNPYLGPAESRSSQSNPRQPNAVPAPSIPRGSSSAPSVPRHSNPVQSMPTWPVTAQAGRIAQPPPNPAWRPIAVPRSPTAGFARTTAILALLLGLWVVFVALGSVISLKSLHTSDFGQTYADTSLYTGMTRTIIAGMLASAVIGSMLLLGSGQIFARMPIGRILVATASGLLLLLTPIAVAEGDPEPYPIRTLCLITLLPAIAVVVGALSRPTRRWLAEGPRSGRRP
ncbi:protein kinase domain-containing protein [Nocardia sp. CA-107356]|uniref:serine/threonine-protein kinase n=1 Tax=Nocardia sp. CA-107356 TaxID=3239972 RepID=UPI003D93F694